MPLSFSLPAPFLNADEAAWWEAVDKALKGQSRARLSSRTADGLEVHPLYNARADSSPLAARQPQVPWGIVQRIDLSDPGIANSQILEDLNGGASGLELVIAGKGHAGGRGIHANTAAALANVLKGVMLDLICIRLDAGHGAIAALSAFLESAAENGVDPASIDLHAGIDPIGWLAVRGSEWAGPDRMASLLRDLLANAAVQSLSGRLLLADGRVWHDAGATDAEELANVFASVLAYLRMMENTGLPAAEWAPRIGICLAADADQIGTTAKARAARRIWASILDHAGLPGTPMHLHMQTSRRMMTRFDPWVNMLRCTTASFAAGIGGADTVSVLPYTDAIGVPDEFARRIARNTQSILLEESNLYKVSDPAAGAGAIEARTEGMITAAWERLQQIEAEGGIRRSLIEGKLQERTKQSAERLRRGAATRKLPITGVSEFPQLGEHLQETLEILPWRPDESPARSQTVPDLPPPGNGAVFAAVGEFLAAGSALTAVSSALGAEDGPIKVERLSSFRLAEEFEALRDAAEELPPVFLAVLGPLSEFNTRARWITSALAAGGIAVTGGEESTSVDETVSAFKSSGSKIAVMASSDTVYGEQAVDAAKALKAAGAEILLIAGKPGESEDALRAAGIDTFLYAGANLLAVLQDLHAKLGGRGGQSEAVNPEAGA